MTRYDFALNALCQNPDMTVEQIAGAAGKTLLTMKKPVAEARKALGIVSLHSSAARAGRDRPDESAGSKLTSQFEANTGVVESRATNVRTLDDLIRVAGVDLDVWEVERHAINKWEVVMREPATTVGGAGDNAIISTGKNGEKSTLWTRGSNTPLHEPMWQVKVWLRRRTPRETALASLLKSIEEKAPLLPNIRHLKPVGGKSRKALELSVMDPHLGLQAYKGESDDPQSLDSMASLILQAVDDLIAKGKMAAGVDVFDEAFMPFGNDFTHTDNIEGGTTAGTNQPEAVSYHAVYDVAERVAIEMVERLRRCARKVYIYEIPGNHSRITDFTLARLMRAYFRMDPNVIVNASADPFKFHRFGVNLIGYDHGHSISPIRLAGLMANERPYDLAEVRYKEWHLGDQHRKGTSKPAAFEEQGVSVEYMPGLTAANGWHRHKAFNHQQRGAVGFVWDDRFGPLAKFHFNILRYPCK